MTAIQTSRTAAKTAFELLQRLISSTQLPEFDVAWNERKLAKMQAVHRCSHLLCPQYPATDTEAVAAGRLAFACGTYTDKHIARPGSCK